MSSVSPMYVIYDPITGEIVDRRSAKEPRRLAKLSLTGIPKKWRSSRKARVSRVTKTE